MSVWPGKSNGLTPLGDAPLVAETPPHLLDDETTPADRFFIRNNGGVPADAGLGDAWRISIDGEVARPLHLSLGEIKASFASASLFMVMECGGNGRSFFAPTARGNAWTVGGVGCARWTGVRLADLLNAAGLTAAARFTGHFGADHSLKEPDQQAMSRGMPIAKALEPHTLLAWSMNGQPLPHLHGGPVRLIVPGWPGSLSSKWLTRVLVRSDPHDGPGMGGTSYRVPTTPIPPGTLADGRTGFADLESMPIRSIVTFPADGVRYPAGTRAIDLRGAAWAGDDEVAAVEVSADAGQSWIAMELAPPRNRYDWRRWRGTVPISSDGWFEFCVRATDSRGLAQPFKAMNWNPQGYGANPYHRIAVTVG